LATGDFGKNYSPGGVAGRNNFPSNGLRRSAKLRYLIEVANGAFVGEFSVKFFC
jgi:hypothetical protein